MSLQARNPPQSRLLQLKVNSDSQPKVKPRVQPPVNPVPKPEPQVKPKADSKPQPVQPKAPPPAAILASKPESLATLLNNAPAQMEFVVHTFVGTAEALIAIPPTNRKNLVLIPENIRVSRNETVSIQSSQTPTSHGSSPVVGNPRYAAPEIFSEKSSGEGAADGAHIYALGIMFYEILLGKSLFEKAFADQKTELDWLRWHADLEKKAPPLKTLLKDYPAVMSDLLEAMMEKHVEKRTPSLEAVRTVLREMAQRASTTIVLRRPSPMAEAVAKPSSTPTAKKSGDRVLWLILLFVFAAGAAFFLWWNPEFFNRAVSFFRHLTQ